MDAWDKLIELMLLENFMQQENAIIDKKDKTDEEIEKLKNIGIIKAAQISRMRELGIL